MGNRAIDNALGVPTEALFSTDRIGDDPDDYQVTDHNDAVRGDFLNYLGTRRDAARDVGLQYEGARDPTADFTDNSLMGGFSIRNRP